MKNKLFSSGRSILMYPAIALISCFLAGTSIFDRASPFAAAFTASLSGADSALAFLGAAAGYLFKGDFVTAVPPICAVAATAVMRIIFSRFKSAYADIGSAVLTVFAVLFTSIVTAERPADVVYSAVFGIMAGVFSYSLMKVYRLLKENAAFAAKPSSLFYIGAVIMMISCVLSGVYIGIFNMGIVFSQLAALIVSYRFKASGGAILSIVCVLGAALCDPSLITAGIILEAGAVVGGTVCAHGKLPQASSSLLTCAAAGALLGMDSDMLGVMADILIASVIFMILPVNALIKKFTFGGDRSSREEGAEIFAERLELIGNTMGELKYAVEKTAETLDKGINRDISSVYNSACDKICKSCRFNMKCWGEEYSNSINMMNSLVKILRAGREVTSDDFSGFLALRCDKLGELSAAVNKNYDEFVTAGQLDRRIKEMRTVLTRQLETTEKLFYSMSEEFGENTIYDEAAAVKACRVLERCGLADIKADVRVTDDGMCIEAYGSGKLSCTEEELGDFMIEALQREFDLPILLRFGKKIRVTMFERALYGVKTASCQISRRKGNSSGDYLTSYIDGKGNFYGIISDGMGSGSRAKIDSAFACGLLTKLLESGVPVETAAEMLNSSLLVKSGDESFATLDVCRINLYSGKTQIYKAGGADTFIHSGRKITKIASMGLPIGVSYAVSMDSRAFTAGNGDVIIMTTDGADLSERWLEQVFDKDVSKDLDELVKSIAAAARFNCEKGREDDISIMAMEIKK